MHLTTEAFFADLEGVFFLSADFAALGVPKDLRFSLFAGIFYFCKQLWSNSLEPVPFLSTRQFSPTQPHQTKRAPSQVCASRVRCAFSNKILVIDTFVNQTHIAVS
jgi:hypothetical protein